MQEFTTVYDVLKEGYTPVIWFPVLLTFITFFIFSLGLLLAWNSKEKKIGLNELGGVVIPLLFSVAGVFLSITAYLGQNERINWAMNGGFDVIQGEIRYSYRSEKREEFTVSGISLSPSIADGGCSYKPQGIKEGRIVRVSYRNGCILKLEVKKEK